MNLFENEPECFLEDEDPERFLEDEETELFSMSFVAEGSIA
jgi:hypothetical protein